MLNSDIPKLQLAGLSIVGIILVIIIKILKPKSNNNYPYTEIENLGTGSFGEVYCIECNSTHERFALKLILIKNPLWKNLETNQEIQTLRNLSHVNIVKYYEHILINKDNNKSFIKLPQIPFRHKLLAIRLELCDYDLLTKLNDRDYIDDEFNRNIFNQILNGIEYLHENHIIHRDLKPANILLKKGIVKIADFGLAKDNVLSGDLINTCNVGSPLYRAPEVLKGKYDKSIDIYSLGVILLQLYITQKLFEEFVRFFGKQNIEQIKLRDNIPEIENFKPLNNLIFKMLDTPINRPKICEIKEDFINLPISTNFQTIQESYSSIYYDANSVGSAHSAKGTLLCLDGGGIRGLVEAQILDYFENETGRKTKQNFEWIAGTSTGGLIALYLGLGHSAKDCIKVYNLLKDNVFGSKEYHVMSECLSSGKNLQSFNENIKSHTIKYENVLKRIFGKKTMADIKHVKVIITATLADKDPMKLIHYTNFDPKTKDVLIWQVARATSAAPTYFRQFFMSYEDNVNIGPLIDGGITANNPTLTALTQIIKYNKNNSKTGSLQLHSCVSIGTGIMPVIDVPFPDLPTSNGVKRYIEYITIASKISRILEYITNELTRPEGHLIEQAEAFCNLDNINYFRFNPELKELIKLDETDDFKLKNMLNETRRYIQMNNEYFQKCLESINEI